MLIGLNSLRQDLSFCDIVLSVDGDDYPCHKIVLCSFSPYFKAMFSGELAESKQNKVSINGVESAMIKALVDYAYTSEVTINKDNVQNLLSAANLLEVLPVRDACCQFMERHMDESNCLGVHCFAEAHACKDLQAKSKEFALHYFPDVCQEEEFVTLTESKLVEFLSDDELCVESEEVVFNAVMRWLDHSRENRSKVCDRVDFVFYLCIVMFVPKADSNSTVFVPMMGVDFSNCLFSFLQNFHNVLKHVRLPLLSPYFLHDCVENQSVISETRACQVRDESHFELRCNHFMTWKLCQSEFSVEMLNLFSNRS